VGWIIVVVIVAVVVVVGLLLWSRSRRKPAPAPPPPAPERVSRVTDTAPMTGLEVALDQVTDSSGRKMRENIETGTAIDDLIVPEDTGPILRRALDNVEHSEPEAPADATGSVAPDTPASEPTGGETPTNEG
jgi:uncharacterized SAM-binding protein YcdF (DUF218 family)